MYHLKVRRSVVIQYDRSCYDCDAYAGLQPGCHYLPDGSASEHAFRTGIPLCKKDRTRRTGCGTDPYRIRYHEQRTRKKRKTSIFPRKRQSRLQKRLLWQQSNTEICPIRQARTTVLILSVLLLLKGIQDRIFYIRLCVLNPF